MLRDHNQKNQNSRSNQNRKTFDATALLVSGSPVGVSAPLLRTLSTQASFILAVDAGAEQLVAAELTPDLLIGDFDSLSEKTLTSLKTKGVPTLGFDPYKDATDIELGLRTLIAKGYRHLIATNVLGGRTDHALSSLGALAGAVATEGMHIALRDDREACYFVNGASANTKLELDFENERVLCGSSPSLPPKPHPRHISLIAWGGLATVTLQGVEWPLDHHVLSPYSALGVSNVLRAPVLTLEVLEGDATVLLLLTY